MIKESTNDQCPICGTHLDLRRLAIGKGEYGEYLEEEFECPHCHHDLTVNTERVDVVSAEVDT